MGGDLKANTDLAWAKRFTGQVAMITGGGQGLGRSTALRLSGEGASICIVDRNAAVAEATCLAVEQAGGTAMVCRADVTNRAEVQAAVRECMERFGRIDVLVNNAGVGHVAEFLEATDEDWETVFRVNLLGSFIVAQEVAREMVKRRSGRIVNMASITAHWANGGQVAYSASKAGVIALTRGIAMELGSVGIYANALSPGPVDTEMTATMLTPAERSAREQRSPIRRLGQPDEIAAAVAFLASSDASYINGAVLNIDGGLLAAGIPSRTGTI